MKILIASYFFYPENTPRAFRTAELVKVFLKNGHKVDLFIPDYNHDYSDFSSSENLKIFKLRTGFLLNKNKKSNSSITEIDVGNKDNKLRRVFTILYNYLTSGRVIEYYPGLVKSIKTIEHDFDLIISISLPFIVNYAVAKALWGNKSATKLVDYGDPFYYYQKGKIAPYFKILERRILKKFYDFILVPTEKILPYFKNYNVNNKIKLIPQGFDFSEIEIAEYKKNKTAVFGYAGLFYNDIRDPRPFFEFLVSLENNFQFVLYTDIGNKESFNLVKEFIPILGNKLIINGLIPRKDCIYHLSKMDFLVNFESSHASPSKLIDYTLSGRPILSVDTKQMDVKKINEFLNSDYGQKIEMDISRFDINNIYDEIIELKD